MVRHLVLPGGLAGTAETMRFIAGELSPDTFVNVMGQYRPAYRARKHAELCRGVSAGEVSDARRLRPRGRAAPGGELMMARVVMVQGTTSHAGKSVLAAALCRMYARRGFRVAPFKAQNMALNSFVTPDGGELGRAQAYQARAAGVEPHVDMNPCCSSRARDATSQVIVLGRPVRHMTVREYHAYQAEVWPAVTTAFERLRAANDLIVIEGAGSPAEINLRGQDIVNMRVALHARCPVLLVGDIDRGGVFASLVGHMELFAPEERELVAAFVINKFRGDASLLDSGIDFLRRAHRRAHARRRADARGLARRRGGLRWASRTAPRRAQADAPLQIAVVRLPYISNYTDFDALADEPDVNVRYATTPAELEGAAAIVLPGTKSTIADLAWLRRSGLAAAVQAAAAAGTPVIGVCGGYQMLGRRIRDPERVESAEPEAPGLGLLDAETTFAADKRTVRVEGEVLAAAAPAPGAAATPAGPLGPAGTPLRGYEIHMGRTDPGERRRAAAAPARRRRHVARRRRRGHGRPGLRQLRPRPLRPSGAAQRLPEPAPRRTRSARPRERGTPADDDIDRLADHVEAHLDHDLLARIVGL